MHFLSVLLAANPGRPLETAVSAWIGEGGGGQPIVFSRPLFAEGGKELVWMQILPDFFTLAAAEAAADEDTDNYDASQHRHGDD